MNPKIPKGGFFAALDKDRNLQDLEHDLKTDGARTIVEPDKGLILAVWTEFEGQGLWRGGNAAVAYDLDLTNEDFLKKKIDAAPRTPLDKGQLLFLLYQKYGLDFLNQLRGSFAFALWDEAEDLLLVVTDPYGIRPIVTAETGPSFIAGSRIRHVLYHPGVDRTLDMDAIYQYLFFSAIPTPYTVYRGIRKLAPGTAMTWTPGGLKQWSYYDIRYNPDRTKTEEDWREAIRTQVRDAVARHTVSLDPKTTGCFLSGGTDSSSVVGFYTQLSGQRIKSFSIGFEEREYNELGYAHLAAEHFQSDQHDYFVTPDDVRNLLENLAEIYDEPFGNSSVVPAYYCARLAKDQGVNMLLAGDGGDEIFGGNERYVTNLVFARYGRIPRAIRVGVLEPLVSLFPDAGVFHSARRYIRRANIPNPDRFFSYNLLYEEALDKVFRPEFLEAVDTDSFLQLARRYYENAAPADETDRLLYIDMKFTITDNDLRKVTQMCEAAGVSVRYPLLDRDLVDFSATIPPELKVKPGRNRYIFKRAMEGFLPGQIIRKSKHGFGLPVGPWFEKVQGLKSLLQDSLLSPNAVVANWIKPSFLDTLFTELRDGSAAYAGGNLWVLLALELWLRNRKP